MTIRRGSRRGSLQEIFRYTKSDDALIIMQFFQKVEPEDGIEPIRYLFDDVVVVKTTNTVDTTPEFPIDHIKRQDVVTLTHRK